MHIDASEDGKECMLGTITDVHLMKMIIIQCTVIDPFSGCPVLIDLLPAVRTVGERAGRTENTERRSSRGPGRHPTSITCERQS